MVDKKKRYEATLNEMKRPIIYDEISEKEYCNGYDIADLLNYKEGKITELEERNNRQYKLLKEIWDLIFDRNWELLNLMYARNWKALEGIVEDLEESDRLLQEIHWCFEKEIKKWWNR